MNARDEADDRPVTVGFDQTNGMAQGLEGESDGTGQGEEESAADRDSDLDAVRFDDASVEGSARREEDPNP